MLAENCRSGETCPSEVVLLNPHDHAIAPRFGFFGCVALNTNIPVVEYKFLHYDGRHLFRLSAKIRPNKLLLKIGRILWTTSHREELWEANLK